MPLDCQIPCSPTPPKKEMQLATSIELADYLIAPDPSAARLQRCVSGRDQAGAEVSVQVVEERPLTIFLNAREIVTAMTIGDYPEYLALGFCAIRGCSLTLTRSRALISMPSLRRLLCAPQADRSRG